ncbi:MAG: NAD(P)(+) transhydrogenase (Re/Si-specific) subunit beta, partial [Bryobacteraceae bacterium]|nr:NAD(P)(+) transhydrogenase (Re/Si-specific) subunit beta [Bryobacteraceae bacterium]
MVLIIFGLKGLSHPRTAVRGNLMGATGMLIAIIATLLDRQILSYEWIIAGLVVGSLIGAVMAQRVAMTAMPQMVALLNGFGGAASALVAGASIVESTLPDAKLPAPLTQLAIAAAASGLIGAVTFWGSLVAFAKLQGLMSENPLQITFLHYINGVLLLGAIGLGALVALNPSQLGYYWALLAVASLVGLLLVIPIGGADMPVVIA